MKKASLTLVLTLLLFVTAPGFISAHQPRIVESRQTLVSDPTVSKAYYGTLTGVPDEYVIETTEPFDLYVGILVPDIPNQKKDVSAVVLKDGVEVAVLDGATFDWTRFFEAFGHDTYWQGPEYKVRAEPGAYVIRVSSSNNDSKYSLAVGEIEDFNVSESINALTLIPVLKREFFNISPADFIFSPMGWGLIAALYILAAVTGLTYRAILTRMAKNSSRGAGKNIGAGDRLIRFAIGIGLLLWAITTTWNPILIFLSGFALFEALFSWCGFYAALGKNTCPTH